MTFLNGYPIGGDRKLPLYAFEPEQISDIVAVSNLLNEFARLRLITNDYIPLNSSESFIQQVNFPLSVHPCLFQRYNPHGLPFADKYSLKLYNFLAKYSYLLVANTTRFLTVPNKDFAQTKYLSFPMGNKIKIRLPETLKKLQLSYYYPEINPYDYTLFLNSQTTFLVTPDIGQDWRNLQPFGVTSPFGRERAYEFSRIQTDCYNTPISRKWKLQCHTLFCNGQEIELDQDILISSLLLTYFDFTQEEINDIENQIPECYLYSYLDTFFKLVEEKLLESNPALANPKIASQANFNLATEYMINHYQNKVEEIRIDDTIRCSGQIIGYINRLRYNVDPNTIYVIGAQDTIPFSIIGSNFVDLPKGIVFGCLTYANNNYWNNYQFSLKDLGTETPFQIIETSTPNTNFSRLSLQLRYLGHESKIQVLGNKPAIASVSLSGNLPTVNTFYPYDPTTGMHIDAQGNPVIAQNSRFADAFERSRTTNTEVDELFNDYYLYLLYDYIGNIPSFNVSIGNYIDETYTVSMMNVDGENKNIMRLKAKKSFYVRTQLSLVNLALSNNDSFYDPRVEQVPLIETTDVLGTIDSTFSKYGQDHPTATTQANFPNNSCQTIFKPLNYSIGYDVPLNFISGTYRFYPSVPINYPSDLGEIVIGNGIATTYLNKAQYVFEEDQTFFYQGDIDLSRPINFNLATKIKPLRQFEEVSIILNKLQVAYERCYMSLCDYEELRKQIEEIWLTLDAGKFAYEDNKPNVSRVANLGYYIERIARVLGISVNSNGSIRSIRQSKRIESGNTIPNGWNLGQWGRNNGGSSSGQSGGDPKHEKDGVAWEIRTNKFKNDDFTGESNAIEQGGYALVENIPQLLHIIMSDLDRAFDLQNAGANVLPTPNGEQIASYQGMNSMLLDLLFTLGQMSRQITGTHILAMKNQAINQELLSGFGLPVAIKELEISAGKPELGVLPFPGFAPDAPTLNDLHALTLTNIGALIGSKIELPKSEEEIEAGEEAKRKLAQPEIEQEIEVLKEKE